ncbi:pca operon transcription factor PcaQ [Agrobacterium sp. SHOUNA12C]|uniref:pca operon transcription factor PcaQ n=1 Tax=Rhizobium TaxID=379 RepID=UPI00026EDE02|nr:MULTISPECIES: pca operon transcription factor PcaQ [Rhizobium]KAA6488712.1 pca operon transcription factor PcaQ [Agrobacterium sp. ICMP 7243]MCJ9722759.1 pca operon transcription factor PcaQ [Agrobacterium sp. BETTINA12B]MCJ9756665.1 pca operon transcription factor PcaQ [Agrobacterium sp. SHOUNA12C]EJK86464.1 pca operon transcription factor PcaQ [Rhizobium sp. AP16]NTF52339.1 pca operon transcription factor PcaQ [Rhizobium rhizogenes]
MIDTRVKFRHLQTFVEVARQKSVVKAAGLLHVSQPAVTKTIRELEEALGVAVFERDGRGIKITRYGEVFLRHAGAALTALRQGLDSVSQERSGEAPPIRIGALPTVSTRIMPRAMELFLKEETWSRIKIVTGENAVLLEQLRVGDLDLVVGRLSSPDKMAGFSFEHLYSEQVVFAVRTGHPLLKARQSLFSNLGKYTILMPPRGSIIRPFVESFLISNGVASLPNQIETVSDSFGRAFVRSSDAVWIISTGVVAGDVEDGLLSLLPIDTSETRGPVGLTMRTDAIPSMPLSILMQTIREAADEVAKKP